MEPASPAALSTSTRVSLSVTLHGALGAGECVGVCFAAPGADGSAPAPFDPARAVLLVRRQPEQAGADVEGGSGSTGGGGGGGEPSTAAATTAAAAAGESSWVTSRALPLARGVLLRYTYGVFATDGGGFLYWEKLTGTSRGLVPSGKSLRLDDVFGEVRLAAAAASVPQAVACARARARAPAPARIA